MQLFFDMDVITIELKVKTEIMYDYNTVLPMRMRGVNVKVQSSVKLLYTGRDESEEVGYTIAYAYCYSTL